MTFLAMADSEVLSLTDEQHAKRVEEVVSLLNTVVRQAVTLGGLEVEVENISHQRIGSLPHQHFYAKVAKPLGDPTLRPR